MMHAQRSYACRSISATFIYLRSLSPIDSSFCDQFMRRFVDHSSKGEKVFFTLAWHDGQEKAFCSRVGPIKGRSTCSENNIVVNSSTPEGRVLVQIVEDLIDPEIISGVAAGRVA